MSLNLTSKSKNINIFTINFAINLSTISSFNRSNLVCLQNLTRQTKTYEFNGKFISFSFALNFMAQDE